jgi:bifunctional non-homologous end joining protein LigD
MLERYQSKRDFKRTPEPQADKVPDSKGSLIFVIQKHAARQLHYDFRLEVDGVLKSWAVAKGPSSDPAIKRLAVMVEDHPLDYAGFEGVIPAGSYGAGQVIVWDNGTYSPDENGELLFGNKKKAEDQMRKGLSTGKISITLRGEKLKGSWTLVRMHNDDKNWLLIKHHDEHADPRSDVLDNGNSVISGLTIDDIKSGSLAPVPALSSIRPSEAAGAAKSSFPVKLTPMLASLAIAPFSDNNWLFEPKLDGFRTLAFLNNGKVRLQSRGELNVTEHYPSLIESIKKQPASQLVLDGEVIALDAKGKLCFQCLQGYLKSLNLFRNGNAELPSAIIYYVFDILYLDGYTLMGAPLKERKRLLKSVLKQTEDVRLVEYFDTDGQTVYSAAIENGLEGVMAKRQESLYEPGKRSKDWLKIKAITSDDFVVAGFTEGTGNRAKTFGALILGYYDEKNILQPAGNVGSGFNNDLLLTLRKQLDSIAVTKRPFQTKFELPSKTTWVKPEMVVEVKFAEWTQDGRLRAPVFLRVRDDKPSVSVHPVKVTETMTDPPPKAPTKNMNEKNDILEQLDGQKSSFTFEIEGHNVSLSNLDKELWPETTGQKALTKRDLIKYLVKVSPYLLPHLKDRPMSLSRYPNGINGEHFFQKHYHPVPEYVETVLLSSSDVGEQEYLLCNNLASLLWLAQIADIELHTWFSRVKPGNDFLPDSKVKAKADYYADYPDFLIFDIDPYIYSGKEASGAEPELNRAAFNATCQVALELKKTLDNLSCPAFVKTSGKTGLHVFIPIMRRLDFHGTHSAAETLSKFMQQQYPDRITTDWAVEKRAGKIFLDYNQNVRGKTLASIYSARPSPQASVSIPLRWDELTKVYPSDFTILNVPKRLAAVGDLWENILEAKEDIVKLFSGMKGTMGKATGGKTKSK